MNNPDENISTGQLPSLLSVSVSAPAPSISTSTPKSPPTHVARLAPTMATSSTSKLPEYGKLHKALGANSLVKSAIMTIPKLTGNEDYTNWSDQVVAALKYCGIEKILTGDWAQPPVTANDADSKYNAAEWTALDSWIALHLNLSDTVRS